MKANLAALPWMDEQTKKQALHKLEVMAYQIGYPKKWKTYAFSVDAKDYAKNMMAADKAEHARQMSKIGRPVDKDDWDISAVLVNAFYDPSLNRMVFPAGILQTPFYQVDHSVAVNLGGMGMVVGHELTHGFDDQGAQFDASGNLVNWWQPDDKAAFETRGKCVVGQYASFEAAPKQFINGELTLGENIADLGGVKVAFRAYQKLRTGTDVMRVADGFTEDQQFFLGVAQAWCNKNRPAEAQRRLTVDRHSPAKFRIYGALRNLPEFAQAFSCAAGTPMHPAQTCSVW
jgi:putative endopeptidase